MRHPTRRERTLALAALLCALAARAPAQDGGAPDAGDAAEATPDAEAESRLRRAETLLEEGEVDAALTLLAALDADGVESARLSAALGRARLRNREYDEAVVHLARASRERPDDYEVLCDFGEALTLQARGAAWDGDYETAGYALLDARRMYEQAAALRPDEAEPWLGAARAERERGDPDEAERLLEKALEADPAHGGALVELASLRFPRIHAAKSAGNAAAAGRERGAVAALYHRALLADEANGYAMNGLGWIALSDDDEAEAVGWFHESLLADPTLTDSYDQLERLLSESSDERKRLVELLDDVVAAAARFAEGDARTHARAVAHYRRGIAHAQVRDAKGLDRDLAQAAKLWPAFEDACEFERVRGLYFDNQYPKATRILLKMGRRDFPALLTTISRQKNPSDAIAMIQGLADKCYRAGDLEGARELFRISAETRVDSADDWNNYAFFARETGAYEESYAAYERALELDPSNPSLLNDTALILHYHLLRDLDHAEDLYARAIEEGKRVLEDDAATPNVKSAVRIAVRDATNNLALLKRARANGGPKGRRPRGKDGAGSGAGE